MRMELSMRFDLLESTQRKALGTEAELDRMKHLEVLLARYMAPKSDRAIQVHII